MIKPWIILCAAAGYLAFGSVAGIQGYRMGAATNEARHVAASLAAARATAARQSAILSAERDARQFAIDQEDAAHAEPVQSPACLPRSRVMRLKSYDAKP